MARLRQRRAANFVCATRARAVFTRIALTRITLTRIAFARIALAGALVSMPALATTACAQVKASEFATVSQTVNGAVITITYSRPSVKGREPVFGGLVPFGDVWTPGANQSTTLELPRDATIAGHAVPKGKYSVWMIPTAGEWTVFLDARADRFHTNRPNVSDAVAKWTVTPESAPPTEFLTWSFPEVRPDGVTIAMGWGTKRVTMHVVLEGR